MNQSTSNQTLAGQNIHHAGYILTISCPDRPGIVHAVSEFLHLKGTNILDSAQFSDTFTGRFFMRVHFVEIEPSVSLSTLEDEFAMISRRFFMESHFYDAQKKPKFKELAQIIMTLPN